MKVVDGQLVERDESEMKDSGVEWIGKIPTSWNVSSTKHFYDIQLGKMLQSSKQNSGDKEVPYLCSINTSWKGVDIDNTKSMWFSINERSRYNVSEGDLIVNEGGDAGRAGLVKNLSHDLYIQNAVHRVRGIKYVSNQFLLYWLYFLKGIEYIELICNKATIMHFTVDKFRNLVLCIPNEDEQLNIDFYLDKKVTSIDNLMDKQKNAIKQ